MTSHRFMKLVTFSSLIALPALVACSGEEPSPSASGGASGSGVTGGTAGSSTGTGGTPLGGSGGMTGGSVSGGTSGAATGGSAGSGAGTGGSGMSGAGGGGAGGAAGGGAGGTGPGGAGAGGAGGGAGGAGGGGRGGAAGSSGAAGAGGGGAFTITTPAFMNMAGCGPMTMASNCATIPVDHTSFGDNVSPAMSWTGAPAGTQSFAVLFQDLSNTMAHWVIWNIPASVTSLPENIPRMAMPGMPSGAQQCSYLGDEGYAGPGACGNVYEFVVYALSVATFSPTMAGSQSDVRRQLQALGAQILGTASMRARSMMPMCGN